MTNDLRKDNRVRIQQLSGQVLDGVARVIGRVAAKEATPSPAIDAVRRHGADLIEAWRFCARNTCHRSRCCRGEPLHCLRLAVPLLPQSALEGLVGKRRRLRRTRPSKYGSLHP